MDLTTTYLVYNDDDNDHNYTIALIPGIQYGYNFNDENG